MPERTFIDHRTGEMVTAEPRPFTEILSELAGGETAIEAAGAFYDLLAAVQDTGKGGTLTLTLKVGFDGAGRVMVSDQVTSKPPQHDRPQTAFFIDKRGNASRRDPNQPTLPSITDIDTRKAH